MAYFLFGAGISLGLMAGLLAITKGVLDLWIFDRYLLVSPSRLLLASALLAIVAAIWNRKLPAARP
jgi:hypothetical protein